MTSRLLVQVPAGASSRTQGAGSAEQTSHYWSASSYCMPESYKNSEAVVAPGLPQDPPHHENAPLGERRVGRATTGFAKLLRLSSIRDGHRPLLPYCFRIESSTSGRALPASHTTRATYPRASGVRRPHAGEPKAVSDSLTIAQPDLARTAGCFVSECWASLHQASPSLCRAPGQGRVWRECPIPRRRCPFLPLGLAGVYTDHVMGLKLEAQQPEKN